MSHFKRVSKNTNTLHPMLTGCEMKEAQRLYRLGSQHERRPVRAVKPSWLTFEELYNRKGDYVEER